MSKEKYIVEINNINYNINIVSLKHTLKYLTDLFKIGVIIQKGNVIYISELDIGNHTDEDDKKFEEECGVDTGHGEKVLGYDVSQNTNGSIVLRYLTKT